MKKTHDGSTVSFTYVDRPDGISCVEPTIYAPGLKHADCNSVRVACFGVSDEGTIPIIAHIRAHRASCSFTPVWCTSVSNNATVSINCTVTAPTNGAPGNPSPKHCGDCVASHGHHDTKFIATMR